MANLEPFSPFGSLNGASKDADPNPVSDLSGNIDHSNFLQTTSLNDQQADETLVKLKDADLTLGINSSVNTGLNEMDDGGKASVASKLDVGLMSSTNLNQSLNVLNDANDTHVPLESKQDADKDVSSSMPNVSPPVSQSLFSNNHLQFAVTGSSNQFTTAPLGSSQNPIRIIQQGNQFVSVQNLTQEQLAQVIQVVQQQQQQQRNNIQSNSTIQAQNKVVYKIVYPNQSNNNISSSNNSNNNNNNTTRMPKTKKISDVISNSLANNRFIAASNNSHLFHPKKKLISTEATDVLMRLNKEQKKKHRPRTRSGRVSKPPQYMVKDYKHIHPVDYDEDYDDSDGGYSDFKMSSGDEDEERESKKSYYKDTHLALSSSKSKKFKCDYCEKSYIGRGGLNRHYRLNPSHGKPDDEDIGDSYYSSDSFQSGSIANTSDALANFPSPFDHHKSSKDGHHNDDDVTLSLEVDTNMGDYKQHGSDGYPDGLSRKGRRGRPPGLGNGSAGGGPSGLSSAEKKKLRLIEVAKSCTDEDILDLFIQRCSSTVSLWKILMSKTTKLYDSSIDSLISEVSNLNEQVSTYLNEKLVPFVEEEEEENEDGGNHGTKNVFEMVDEKMAACLNVPIGKYIVKVDEYFEGSVQAEEPTIYQELNHMDPTTSLHSTKDHIEEAGSRNVSPHKDDVVYSKKIKHQDSDIPIALPPRKRLKLTDLNQDADDFINEFKQSRKVVRFDNDDEEDSIDDNKSAALASSSLTSPAADDDNDRRNVIDNKVLLTSNFDDITDDGSEFHVKKESDPNNEKRPLDFINIQPVDNNNPTSFNVESGGLGLKNENDSNIMAAFNSESATAITKEQPNAFNTSTTNTITTVQNDVVNQQINLNSDLGNVSIVSQQPTVTTNTENGANNFDHKIVTSLLQQLSQQQLQQQQQQQLQQHQQEIFNKSNIPQTLTNNEYFPNAIFQNDASSNVAIMSNNNQLIAVTPYTGVSDIQNHLQQQQLQQIQLQMQQQKQLEQQLLMQQQIQQQQLQQQLMQQQQSQLLQQQQLQTLQQHHQQQQQQQQHQPPQQICVTCYPLQEYIQLQENAQYVQTEDGMVVVKNADGSYQIYGTITQNITVDLLESLFNSNNNVNINSNNSTNNNLNNLVNNI